MLTTTAILALYGYMWWNILRSRSTKSQTRLSTKHRKFALISGVIVLSCTASWMPDSVVAGYYIEYNTAYLLSLCLHYLITVVNPVVYIFGTQGNVGQAIVSTPVQYRRRVSRSSMYNSETVRNPLASPSLNNLNCPTILSNHDRNLCLELIRE